MKSREIRKQVDKSLHIDMLEQLAKIYPITLPLLFTFVYIPTKTNETKQSQDSDKASWPNISGPHWPSGRDLCLFQEASSRKERKDYDTGISQKGISPKDATN